MIFLPHNMMIIGRPPSLHRSRQPRSRSAAAVL